MLHTVRERGSGIPNKSTKFRLEIYAWCDAKTFYFSNVKIYVGVQPHGSYCVENTSLDIANIEWHLSKSNKSLTTDKWDTRFPHAWFLTIEKPLYLDHSRRTRNKFQKNFYQDRTELWVLPYFDFRRTKHSCHIYNKVKQSCEILSIKPS